MKAVLLFISLVIASASYASGFADISCHSAHARILLLRSFLTHGPINDAILVQNLIFGVGFAHQPVNVLVFNGSDAYIDDQGEQNAGPKRFYLRGILANDDLAFQPTPRFEIQVPAFGDHFVTSEVGTCQVLYNADGQSESARFLNNASHPPYSITVRGILQASDIDQSTPTKYSGAFEGFQLRTVSNQGQEVIYDLLSPGNACGRALNKNRLMQAGRAASIELMGEVQSGSERIDTNGVLHVELLMEFFPDGELVHIVTPPTGA